VTERDIAIWDRIAPHWDAQLAEGNDFQKLLVMPATDRLLALRPGMVVIDACCGNGNYARRLGRAGCRVIAFDGSATFVELARRRHVPGDGDVTYRVADACDPVALAKVAGSGLADAVVSSMALMDLPDLAPLLSAGRRWLRPDGRFVFSVAHPCWNSNEADLTARLVQGEGEPRQVFAAEVVRYASDWPHLSRGLLNQPEPHWLYHRSISTLLGACFAGGFLLDGFEEPVYPDDLRLRSPFAWVRRPELPPAIVARLRPAPG
jgi:SAM-dependent methyltransferase